MPELIERKKALKNICKYCAEAKCKKNECMVFAGIKDTPTVEPKVRQGRWGEMQCFSEHGVAMADYECTNCGGEITKQRGYTPKWCEHCGARMDGGANDAGSKTD